LYVARYGASEPAEIESVKKGGAAAQKGLKKGMVLVSVQGKPTPSYDEAIAMIQATGPPCSLSSQSLNMVCCVLY
jgi:membrane-associated protease RseP (regulator of RpoE activity)